MVHGVTKETNIINKILTAIKNRKVQLAFELDYFNKYRWWSDGVDFVTASFQYDNKGDHTPRLSIFVGVFNFKLIDMSLYNTYHDDSDD